MLLPCTNAGSAAKAVKVNDSTIIAEATVRIMVFETNVKSERKRAEGLTSALTA